MALADRDTAVRALNRLLQAESASFLPRLAESTPFVSWADADDYQAVGEMIRQEAEHVEWLVAAIVALDGSPAPPRPDVSTADIHYCELRSLLPRVVADKQRLVEVYQSATPAVAGAPSAAHVAGRILARHREHLETLQSMFSPASPHV